MARLGLIWGGGAVILHRGFPGSSVVKNPPAMQEPQETYAQSLSQEDRLEEERATHSSILAWRNPIYTGAWGATVRGVAENQT